MRASDIPEVASFISKMDSDMRKFKDEFNAESRLAEAVENYEKVFGVKIKIPLATEEVKV